MDVIVKADQMLPIFYDLNVFWDQIYCFPGQKKILERLIKWRGLKISIATLNRWLRHLEDEGYIYRTRRTRTDKRLGKMFQSTMYKISKKGYGRLAVSIAGVWKWYNSKFKNGWERKKKSKETPKKHLLEQVDQKVRDLAAGVLKKPIY